MRKREITFVALTCISGAAAAQSSVALFGTVDLNARYVKSDGQSRNLSVAPNGLNSNQFGVRGEEDLGNGLRAGILLLGDVAPNTGVAGDTARGKFWNRQALLRLGGNFGEVRLGRDYTSTFMNQATFDVFGALGLGGALNVNQMYPGTRVDNSITYSLPKDLGGVYGEVKVAPGENGVTQDRPGRYLGARVGYATGAFDVSFAAGQLRFSVPFNIPAVAPGAAVVPAVVGDVQKTYIAGASYNFGFMKVMGYFEREVLSTYRQNVYSLSAIIPFGLSEVHVGYDRSNLDKSGSTTSVDQLKVGYVYKLSKRTALYSTASRVDNKNGTRVTLPSAAGLTTVGGKSQGFDFGVRHFF